AGRAADVGVVRGRARHTAAPAAQGRPRAEPRLAAAHRRHALRGLFSSNLFVDCHPEASWSLPSSAAKESRGIFCELSSRGGTTRGISLLDPSLRSGVQEFRRSGEIPRKLGMTALWIVILRRAGACPRAQRRTPRDLTSCLILRQVLRFAQDEAVW